MNHLYRVATTFLCTSKLGRLSMASHVQLVVGKNHELIKKILTACRQLLLAKRHEAVHLIYAVNFIALLISACTYLAIARAVKFYQNYDNHSFELISSIVFAQKAFGSVKTSNFVSMNIARTDNFTS